MEMAQKRYELWCSQAQDPEIAAELAAIAGNDEEIFERFYRMDASRNSQTGGYGIGLSVAKAIVAAHNGRISATTEDGHSLQISVQFPV